MARVTKGLRSSARDGGDFFMVVKGSDEASLRKALSAVWTIAEQLDPLFSPNSVNVSPLPAAKLSLVVDLKGETELHAKFLDLLANELPDEVVLTDGGGSVFDMISDWRGVVLRATVWSEASAEPWILGGRSMPAEWGRSVAKSLAAISGRGEVFCTNGETVLFQATPDRAFDWLEQLRIAGGGVIIGGNMAVVADDQLVSWQHLSDRANLTVYGARDVDAAEATMSHLIEQLAPVPLSATIEVQSGHSVWFDDISDRGRYNEYAGGPELLRKVVGLGPTHWLPPLVADDVEFRAALESSGVDFALDNRLLRFGTASDWTNLDVRHRYQRLALRQIRPWTARE